MQRAFLVAVLEADGDIEIVGEATTALDAIALTARLRPDVVTLDLEIPEGGGLHALEQIMAFNPTPVVVLSSTVQSDRSASAIAALVGGALMVVPKPARWTPTLERELRANVRLVRNVPVIRHVKGRLRATVVAAPDRTAAPVVNSSTGSPPVVAIAASTGGPPALSAVLGGLAGLEAPVLVVQHLHPDFVQGLAEWMTRVSPLPVVIAEHGQLARRGHVHIGPGGVHLRLGPGSRIELIERPTSVHRPSADQLFRSVAEVAGGEAVGVILTGMGDDGAAGLAAMHSNGAHTIGQDEATSAIYGMPKAAYALGALDQVLPLSSIADAILCAVHERTRTRR